MKKDVVGSTWFSCRRIVLGTSILMDTLTENGLVDFTADLRIEQPDALLGAAFGISGATWSGGMLTPRERTDTLRYTLTETVRGKTDGWAFQLAGAGRRRVRFERLLVEKLGRVRNRP